jgi:hypothetical protein
MAGSAGSKYGISDDGIPLKKISEGEGMDTTMKSRDATQKKLKDVRRILRRKKAFQSKPHQHFLEGDYNHQGRRSH